MTTPGWAEPTTPIDSGRQPDPGSAAARTPAGQRGETIIAPGVVSVIAARAALRVGGVIRSEPSGLARVLKTKGAGMPDASTRIDEGRAQVQLKVTVAYPKPVWTIAEDIRRRVREDVQRFTGLGVGEIDLEIGVVRPVMTHRRVV